MSHPPRHTSSPAACGLAVLLFLPKLSVAAEPSLPAPDAALAAAISRLIEHAIPLEYDKQKDWGAVAEIPVGVRTEGRGWRTRLKTRNRTVNHGVWKHYRLRLVDPEEHLRVQLAEVRPVSPGRVAFALSVEAEVDAWARAKVYEYGVHLIAVEVECDLRMHLAVDGELAVEFRGGAPGPRIALVPVVKDARLAIDEFHLRRVSNAKGPLVRELGKGVRGLVEDELNGPKLTEKLNRAIDKKRDRLEFRPGEFIEQRWRPLAVIPATGPTMGLPTTR